MNNNCPHCNKPIDEKYMKFHIRWLHTEEGRQQCRYNGKLGSQIQKDQRLHLLDEPVRVNLVSQFEQSFTREHKQSVRKKHKSW